MPKMITTRLGILLGAAVVLTAGMVELSKAGGPLLIWSESGQAVTWAKGPVKGGKLDSMTVNESGQVVYRVDQGDLGPVDHETAVRMVDRIFNEYNRIETSTLRFVNGGPILNPNTGEPVDVTGSNYGLFSSSSSPAYQNPVIFDTNGEIAGRGGVLGFVYPLDTREGSMREGVIVLNGFGVNSLGGMVPFLGVFTHEFGHFAGPLDHAQVNGRIGSRNNTAELPAGFSPAQLYDLFTPFTETLYPFLYSAPPTGSDLAGRGFRNSGYFTATLDLDTETAMSNLYPAPGFLSSDPGSATGSIAGEVVAKTDSFDLSISGLNIVARRIGRGAFPPPVGTQAFPGGGVPLDQDGAPLLPPNQDATDPLVTAISAVSGLLGGPGCFQLNGLPPGEYRIFAEGINPNATGGSGIGQFDPPVRMLTPEYYNGPDETNDPAIDEPNAFVPVKVDAGSTVDGIRFVLNGFGGTVPTAEEAEPNDGLTEAQPLPPQSRLQSSISESDPAKITLELGGGQVVSVHDLYRVEVPSTAMLLLSLHSVSPSADLDLYLFDSRLKEGRNPLRFGPVVAYSAGETGTELIMSPRLAAGSYFIGVSGYSGSTAYSLVTLNSAQFVPPVAAGNRIEMKSAEFAGPSSRTSFPAGDPLQLLRPIMLVGEYYARLLGV